MFSETDSEHEQQERNEQRSSIIHDCSVGERGLLIGGILTPMAFPTDRKFNPALLSRRDRS
jgi:hypothetical protein